MKSKFATSSSFNSLIIAKKKTSNFQNHINITYLPTYNQQQNFKNKQQFCWICGEGRSETGTCLASMSRYLPAPIALSISAMEGRCRLFCCCCCFFGRDVVGFVVCMRGLVGFVWIVVGGGESLVGREARARGLVMETQDKQYMVCVCYFHLRRWTMDWIFLLILQHKLPSQKKQPIEMKISCLEIFLKEKSI